MAQPYVGEIRMFAGNFAPVGWMFCEGQLLPISENETLFMLVGTTFGGDGENTFALPDLRGRLPMHQGQPPQGQAQPLGATGGAEEVTLTVQQIPSHTHVPLASLEATAATPTNNVLAQSANSACTNFGLDEHVNAWAGTVGPVGGSGPHTNFQPYLCVNFIISLFGLFPQQT